MLPIQICMIDSGYLTDEVYTFVLNKQSRVIAGYRQQVLAVKGAKIQSAPLIPARPTRVGKNKRIRLYNLGVNNGKSIINQRLQLKQHGPGYMHFPMAYDEEYFNQLTNEVKKMVKGIAIWIKRSEGARNEALDVNNYLLAGLRLLHINWEQMTVDHEARINKLNADKPEKSLDEQREEKPEKKEPEEEYEPKPMSRRRRSGWATGWKGRR